jgi:hypothetical protein
MMKVVMGVAILACASLVIAKTNVPYPAEKLAEFVVDKLDVTTLPSDIRPRREKAKKTFRDYGYVTRQVDEKTATVEPTTSGLQISLRVLQQEAAGIYVCAEGSEKNSNKTQVQRVLLLKLKDQNGFLKSRESAREFAECPVTGGSDQDSATSSY